MINSAIAHRSASSVHPLAMSGLIVATLALALASCATKPKQVVNGVCVDVSNLPAYETAFMLKRSAAYLHEYGLSQVAAGCDVTVKYQAFGEFQAEVVSGFAGMYKKGYWSQEGNVTINHRGSVVLDDEPILLRGYDSRQEVLNETAWQMVKPVTKAFRSASVPAP